MSIGERIKRRRLELNMSVEDLANKLGKNRATVYRYESDEIENLPIPVLEPLARALDTTPAFLMGWEKVEEADHQALKKQTSLSPEVVAIERAREKMDPEARERMMDILTAAFREYFKEDFKDEDDD